MKKITLRLMLIISTCTVTVLTVWIAALYWTYGYQTFMFVIRSPWPTFFVYSKNMLPSPTAAPVVNTTPSTSENQVASSPVPAAPNKAYLEGMSHMYQKLNNCGPSSAAMATSILGHSFDQFEAAKVLKGGDGDKNVAPDEMVAFIQSKNLGAQMRVAGTPEQIEQLVAQGFPVIVEQWLEKRGTGELVGHYRVVRGYQKNQQLFITNDSFNGPDFSIPYSQFDEWWRPFNRLYIVVYPPEKEEIVKNILGADWDVASNWERAKKEAFDEISSRADGYAHFNAASSLTALKQYPQAVKEFETALAHEFPEHFLWYRFEPLEAWYQEKEYQKVNEHADQLIAQAGQVEEAWYYKGLVARAQNNEAEADAFFQKALGANPRYLPALQAIENTKTKQ